MKKDFRSTILIMCLFFIFTGCNSSDSGDKAMNDSVSKTSDSVNTSAPIPLTDAEIASVVLTINQVELDNASIAINKSKDPFVADFAKTLTKDYQSLNEQAEKSFKEVSITPENNLQTQSLEKSGSEIQEMLNFKTGADFNKAYLNNEVTYHRSVIDLIEHRLIPDVKDAAVKNILQTALLLFKKHLADAEKMQKELEENKQAIHISH